MHIIVDKQALGSKLFWGIGVGRKEIYARMMRDVEIAIENPVGIGVFIVAHPQSNVSDRWRLGIT